ncbi:venom serine carboxypeptidase-like [Dermacentor andersoni]|uniref:venom serine carboxypeptidase-like n=1 Tax=Dermacentor andersoni TaxID=34620 RepID=UPI002415E7A4|nr:venom serine carboxypeptidase-like [Dermacentor andersoni]XP_054925102.1 venom serine carboxypeptidase-like [Dermacentor andersoni]
MHSSVWIFVVLAAGLQYVHGSDENSPLFLTPYINACEYETAKNLSQVKLFQEMANVSAYSGLITVNSTYNSSLFFLFLVAEGNKSNAPILLWTQGGPGLSSLFGQFLENGPIAYDPISNFSLRSNTLQKNMSVIYLDVPVGTGFSVTANPLGYSTKLEDITEHVMEFMRQFLELFSEFKDRDFYLAGESYGARYSVAIAHQLLTDNKQLPLKLKGIIGGNGFLGPVLDTANSAEFLYQASMLDENGRMQFDLRFQYMKNLTSTNITVVPFVLLSTIFADPTRQQPSVFQNLTSYNDHASPLYTERPFHMLACFVFLNSSSMLRRQIHVGEGATFQYANQTLIAMFASDWLRDITNLTQRVLNETRVLFYTGQLDALFPAVNQRDYFSTLKWAHAEDYQSSSRVPWRPPTWNPYMGYAGFMKQAANFTDIVLLGMSHYGAADKPDEAYHLITQFVEDKLKASVSSALGFAGAQVA